MLQIALTIILVLVGALAVTIIAHLLTITYQRAQKPLTNSLPKEPEKETLTALQQLIRAPAGSFWIITRTEEETKRTWHEIFIRGEEILMEQLDALLKKGPLTAFDRANPQHKRILMTVLHGTNGILVRLTREEEIGWAGAEIIRQCVHWGLVPQSQLMTLYQSTATSSPRQPGSRGTEAGLARLQLILNETASAPVRRDSQFLRIMDGEA